MAFSKNRRLAQIISDVNGNISVQGITVPTQSASDNDTSAASTAYVTTAVSSLIDSAPDTLNTLNEIAAALNDDANFNTTVTNSIAAKAPLASPTFTGTITFGDSHTIGNDGDDNLSLASSANENIIIDSADDIILDADGGDIKIKDDGTQYGLIANSSTDLIIQSTASDRDMIFRGNDGGSTVVAMTLDMSEAGKAIFNAGGLFGNHTRVNGDFSVSASSGEDRFAILPQSTGSGTILMSGNEALTGYEPLTVDFEDLKLRTSGTERIRIDTSGRMGFGMTPSDYNGYMLQMTGGSQSFIAIGNNTTGTGALNGLIIGNDGTGADIYQRENQPLRFHTNNLERMRIANAGNVGVGTINPQYKFDVYGTDDITMRIHRPSSGLGINDTCGIGFSQRGDTNTSSSDTRAAIVSTYNGSLHLCTEPGGNLNSNPVDHSALTIDGTYQNVGIGTSAPATKLHISNNAAPANDVTLITLQNGNSTGDIDTPDTFIDFEFKDSNSNVTPQARIGAHCGDGTGADTQAKEGKGYLTFHTSDTTATSGVVATPERMRINASGCIGLNSTADRSLGTNIATTVTSGSAGSGFWLSTGNSSATSTKLISYQNGSVGEFKINQGSGVNGGSILFSINDDTKMRINSNGRVAIGTSSALTNLTIGGTSSTARIVPATDNVGYIGESTHRWQAIYAVSGSIQTSDEREKTETKETTLGLNFIKDLKPITYKWIDGEQQNKGKDEREHQGLIAQQVAETVEKHGIDKNSFGGLDIQKTDKYDDFHGMSYDQFIAPLIKAIQEQQTIIEDLKARITTLEG